MDQQTQQNDFDQAFSLVPHEVSEFMWSDAYDMIINTMQEVVGFDMSHRDFVKRKSYELLAGLRNVKELGEDFLAEGIPSEQVAKILFLIDSEIVTRAKNITEYYTPENEEGEVGSEKSSLAQVAPSPADVLQTLKSRLTEAKTVAPSSRQFDIGKSAPQTETQKPSADPYRETPN